MEVTDAFRDGPLLIRIAPPELTNREGQQHEDFPVKLHEAGFRQDSEVKFAGKGHQHEVVVVVSERLEPNLNDILKYALIPRFGILCVFSSRVRSDLELLDDDIQSGQDALVAGEFLCGFLTQLLDQAEA